MPKRRPRPTAGRPPSAKVKALSHRLKDLLAEDQMRSKVPKGMAKCPLCGGAVEPPKTKRIRVHDDPLRGARCDAGTRLWEEFGKAAPRAKPVAAKGRTARRR